MRGWTWTYEGYDPGEERLREAICTLGNGVFATRGAACESPPGTSHYPGTYAAGCYNRLESGVAGHRVDNEDMVNLPDWLPLRYRMRPEGAEPGAWLTLDGPELTEHRRTLDLRQGTLTTESVYADGAGHRLSVRQQRLVHMAEPHIAALRTEFTAHDWSGHMEVAGSLNADVRNAGVERYRHLAGRHLTGWRTGTQGNDTVWLTCRTTSSGWHIAMAARTRATAGGHAVMPEGTAAHRGERSVSQTLVLPVREGRTAGVDKTVALHLADSTAAFDDHAPACETVSGAPGFRRLLATHRAAWRQIWDRTRLEVKGEEGRILRLHLFHVLQTLSPHTVSVDAGVPARGLHGEAYRGHVFWDELFVLPFLNLHFPEVSRALLGYRYRRLAAACRAARDAGRTGAMYPWQSGSDGREETQRMHLNPRSGRWLPDHSHLQHHVGSAVAYNVWRHWQHTGDREFLRQEGAEMLLQVARFWASRSVWDPALGRYRIRGVVGPDEYHDAYPDAERPGLDDNAYTNVTAAWVLARALEICDLLPASELGPLSERVGMDPGERGQWEHLAHRLHVPLHGDVISQFAGYGELAELDWAGYRARYGDIRRLDRILEAEDDTVNRYQASKQADVLMLGYLFSPSELTALFRQLGHRLDDDTWRATVDYYLRRTSHGSTLSSVVHAWVLARVHRTDAWTYCEEALHSDVADIQGGTTAEGIHLGAMAGTLDFVQRGLTGLEFREGTLFLDPAPLPQFSKFGICLRLAEFGEVTLRLRRERVEIAVPEEGGRPLQVRVAGQRVEVGPGTAQWVSLTSG